jgi:hypothetical protein
MRNTITTILMIVLILFSCEKAKESNTKREFLLASKWKLTGARIDGGWNSVGDCLIDDIITYASDNTFTLTTVSVKCSSSDNGYVGTWSLSSDESTMIFDRYSGTLEILRKNIRSLLNMRMVD